MLKVLSQACKRSGGWVALTSIGVFLHILVQAGNIRAEDVVQFNSEIRPILADNCFHCHGPDERSRQADLRLDVPSTSDQSSTLVPGNPDQSQLYQRLVTDDADLRMPPASSHKQLSQDQIALIKIWIQQGAPYETHWSLKPISHWGAGSRMDGSAGETSFSADQSGGISIQATVSQVIDRWIDLGHQQSKLVASPPADPVTLLRRLWLDVVGLPPSRDVVNAFLNDSSQEAYAGQVDQLLASPHFGERMAIWWLDLVRFADSVGYHGDQEVSVWPYRDYVIDSFNQNKPWTQFTIEQLAGDLLPQANDQTRIASGYNRLGMMSAEGGVQDKEYLAKYVAERVRNVSGTWLGLTMGCCECHDHKFDSFTSREFYQMEAFFADVKERGLYAGANADGNWGPNLQTPSPQQVQQLAQLNQARADIQAKKEQQRQAAQSKWEHQIGHWHTLVPLIARSESGSQLTVRDDHSVMASGQAALTDTYEVSFLHLPDHTTAFKLQVLPDESLPKRGPGRAANGNFVLTEVEAAVVAQSDSPATSNETVDQTAAGTNDLIAQPLQQAVRQVKLVAAAASVEQTESIEGNPYQRWSIAATIDQDAKGSQWGWAVLPEAGRGNEAVFRFESPLTLEEGQLLKIRLVQKHEQSQHLLGRFRLLASTESLSPEEMVHTRVLARALQRSPEQRTARQQEIIRQHFLAKASQLQPLRDQQATVDSSIAKLKLEIPTTLITQSVPPREIRVLPRGNWLDDSGEIVMPAFPAAIHVPSFSLPTDRRMTRLDLAQWLVAPDHPVTARVLTNRLWKLYFGAGLSRKLDDVGAQGEPPTHPELLDYLSQQLIQSGWNIKQLIRSMLLTRAYQRSSLATEEQLGIDPTNRLLARQARFRLDAELVRDNAMAVSGLLSRQIGGRSVKPYQPAGYWDYLNFPTRQWKDEAGDQLYRRGLYTHWQRQYLHPSLLAFDAPNREECTADRPRSNTPLQSLALLNDPTYIEAARVLAARAMTESVDNDQDRIVWLFSEVLSREPLAGERQLLGSLLESARLEYRDNPSAAEELLAVGNAPRTDHDAQQLAAWCSVTRTLLNLHEFVTRN